MAVLITRPKIDSLILKKALDTQNICSFVFPTLEIKQLQPILDKNYQVVVFISKNSVDFGIKYLKQLVEYKILAVGSATASRLLKYGYKADYYPKNKPSSTSLLAIAEVVNIKNSNILIMRGVGGVNTLKLGFENNNNIVDYLEVYERIKNTKINKYRDNLEKFLQENPQIIIITSCDILEALVQLTDKIDKNIKLLVISERIKKYAISIGFSRIIVTKGITNLDIITGVKNWLN